MPSWFGVRTMLSRLLPELSNARKSVPIQQEPPILPPAHLDQYRLDVNRVQVWMMQNAKYPEHIGIFLSLDGQVWHKSDATRGTLDMVKIGNGHFQLSRWVNPALVSGLGTFGAYSSEAVLKGDW